MTGSGPDVTLAELEQAAQFVHRTMPPTPQYELGQSQCGRRLERRQYRTHAPLAGSWRGHADGGVNSGWSLG